MNENEIRAWLLGYAWFGTAEQKAANVACIMAQGDWRHLSGRAEHYRSMAVDDTQAAEAEGFALSALYECHEGPHTAGCSA